MSREEILELMRGHTELEQQLEERDAEIVELRQKLEDGGCDCGPKLNYLSERLATTTREQDKAKQECGLLHEQLASAYQYRCNTQADTARLKDVMLEVADGIDAAWPSVKDKRLSNKLREAATVARGEVLPSKSGGVFLLGLR